MAGDDVHNSLSGLPKRVALDTNVLLDAAYVADGTARRAVSLLRAQGYSLIIDDMMWREATKVLYRYTRDLGLTFDPRGVLRDFVRARSILVLPPGDPQQAGDISRADRHVVAAARQYDAWVLTGDAPLVVECQEGGVAARQPWDVIMEAATAGGGQPTLGHLIRVMPPSREQGLLFGRVIPGAWADAGVTGRFTVCDVEHVGRLLYEAHTQQWVFAMPVGAVARVKCPVKQGETWVICGAYRLPGGGAPGTVSLRVGRYPLPVGADTAVTREAITARSPGRIQIGRSVEGADSWNGHVRAVVVGPQGMSKGTWKAITAIPEGAPNPYDNDALRQVLVATQALNAGPGSPFIRLPTEQSLWPRTL